MMRLSYRAAQAALYSLAPFYAWPGKGGVCAALRSGYDVSQRHFSAGHRGAVNLAWHAVCLCLQLLGNFGLLAAVLPPALAALTALGWAATLLRRSAPRASRAPRSCSWPSRRAPPSPPTPPRSSAPRWWRSPRAGCSPRPLAKAGAACAGAAAWAAVWYAVGRVAPPGAALPERPAAVALLLALVALGSREDPVTATVAGGALGARLLAVLAASPALHLFSLGFLATLMQGASHALTKENATLLALQREHRGEAKVAYELAHVCFFPVLLLHAESDALAGARSG